MSEASAFAPPSSPVRAVARPADRSEVPDRYKWDLTPLYADTAAWLAARDDLARRIPGLARHLGRLAESADTLHAALVELMDLDRDLSRLATYAHQVHDEDTRIARHLEMRQTAEQLAVQFRTAAAFVRPEILAAPPERIRGLAADPRLAEYRHYLEDILRRAPHTLSPAEEKIAAQAGRFAGASESVRSVFTNAELPYPELTLSTGERVRLDAAAYTRHRAAPSRADRVAVFRAFWGKHREFRGTLGAALNGQVQAHVFHKDVHRFATCLEAALFGDRIPTRVYTRLIEDVRAHLPTLHRYLRLRQRLMRLDRLGYEDLYPSIVPEVDLRFTPEEAMELTLGAVAPLGAEYVATLRRGFEERWVDWLPTPGKSSGAYSTGAYGVHPYQLQNFTGLYEEVSTLAHEAGHSMHTWLADRAQPYVTHDYATFVAEVASTLNENLLFHHLLDRARDRDLKLFLLGSHLDHLRGTLFRQTLFAEFELAIHERAERGETLTGENLSELYLGLLRTAYGHDLGVCEIDELYGVEWAYVDHFFFDFYVFQYATSVVAAHALAGGILEEARAGGGRERLDAYLRLLSSGSSGYPIDLLAAAGVDMTTSAPFEAAMREMNATLDEIERLTR